MRKTVSLRPGNSLGEPELLFLITDGRGYKSGIPLRPAAVDYNGRRVEASFVERQTGSSPHLPGRGRRPAFVRLTRAQAPTDRQPQGRGVLSIEGWGVIGFIRVVFMM